MKNSKKIVTTLLTVAVLLMVVFAAGRYGWTLLKTGDFDVAIPVKGGIREVVLKTEPSETTIWTSETDEAAGLR